VVEVAGLAKIVGVDPDIGAGQEAIEIGFEACVEGANPSAIVAMGVADKDVVLEAWDEGHERRLVYQGTGGLGKRLRRFRLAGAGDCRLTPFMTVSIWEGSSPRL